MNEPTPTRPTTVPLVRQATVSDIDLLVPLFDGYRQFYRQASEPDRIRRFLLDRFEHNQSVIFVAVKDRATIGFTQLYPSFSSGALARIYVLNDIFVDPGARRAGAGAALLEAAAHYARCVGAVRLVLSTELTNSAAPALYEKTGWKRNTEFCTYQLALWRNVTISRPACPLHVGTAHRKPPQHVGGIFVTAAKGVTAISRDRRADISNRTAEGHAGAVGVRP